MKVAFEAGRRRSGGPRMVSGPLRSQHFLIDTVYNDGIRELLNKVAGVVGADKLGGCQPSQSAARFGVEQARRTIPLCCPTVSMCGPRGGRCRWAQRGRALRQQALAGVHLCPVARLVSERPRIRRKRMLDAR